MASKFGYRLTQKAESDLDVIVSYIAVELSNPPAASDFVNKLQENIEEARNFPESGSLIYNDFLQAENVRKKLVGNYIMYYLPDTRKKQFTFYVLYIANEIWMKFLKNWMFNYVSIGHKLIGALSYYQFVFGFKNQASHHWVNTLW